MLIDCQIGQKGAHCFCIQFAGMSFTVEDDVPFDPIAIGFLSAQAEMAESSDVPNLVEQLPGHR